MRPISQRCETNFNVHLFGCRRSRWSYARLRSKQTHKRNQLAFKYPTYLNSSKMILHLSLSVHIFRFRCNRRPPVSSCSCVHRFSCTTNSVTQTQWNFSISDDVLTTTSPIASIRVLFAFQEMIKATNSHAASVQRNAFRNVHAVVRSFQNKINKELS